jgi:hypothetical protein
MCQLVAAAPGDSETLQHCRGACLACMMWRDMEHCNMGGRWGTEHQVYSQAWSSEPSCTCGHDLCEGVPTLRGPSGAFCA